MDYRGRGWGVKLARIQGIGNKGLVGTLGLRHGDGGTKRPRGLGEAFWRVSFELSVRRWPWGRVLLAGAVPLGPSREQLRVREPGCRT